MLRITAIGENGTPALKLEGSLAGSWVPELARAAESCFARTSRLRLDLGAVGYVDAEGTRLLESLVGRGAEIESCSHFVAALLKGECR